MDTSNIRVGWIILLWVLIVVSSVTAFVTLVLAAGGAYDGYMVKQRCDEFAAQNPQAEVEFVEYSMLDHDCLYTTDSGLKVSIANLRGEIND